MTDRPHGERWAAPAMQARLRARHRAETRFQRLGWLAIALAIGVLAVLLASIGWRGIGAFTTTEIRLDVALAPEAFGPAAPGAPAGGADLARADYRTLAQDALRALFPDVTGRQGRRELAELLSRGAGEALREAVARDPARIGGTLPVWLPADDEVDLFRKAGDAPGAGDRLSAQQVEWLNALASQDRLRARFATRFLTAGDSREPELAGIRGALVGSFLTLVVTLAIVFPLGVSAAVYLEEFAPRSRWTDLIEVNINNLAAVPSIVFGLLGLAVFLGVANLPRSAPLVGGLTLALMTLPTIIIAGRVSIQAVPPSIREAARGVGASPLQVVAHHVLPLAMPGILTGTIIGMARALGETAPLLMIGMVAFVVDVPGSLTDASTALPVQIYLWAESPERAFEAKTSGAILVLLGFLIAMNATAIALRRRFEKRW
jgi:phosphate transport system permease protein